MLQLFYPTAIQQAGLLLLCGVFLFLGLNVAVAWGQAQYATTRTKTTTSSSNRKSSTYTSPKSITKHIGTKKTNNKPPSSSDFSMPDGEYLDVEPSTIHR
jgi:hypothetical protein